MDCVGRFIQLTDDCNAHKTVAGDFVVVSGHVTGGAASTNRTDLMVVARDDMEDAKAASITLEAFKARFAQSEITNLSNGTLGSICSAGRWKILFRSDCERIKFTVLSIDRYDGKVFTLSVPRADADGCIDICGPYDWLVTRTSPSAADGPFDAGGYFLTQQVVADSEGGAGVAPVVIKVRAAWLRNAIAPRGATLALIPTPPVIDFDITIDKDIFPRASQYFEDALGSEALKARSVIACLLGTTVTPLVASVTDRSERATINRVVIRAISEIEAVLEAAFDAEGGIHVPHSLEVLARSLKEYCYQYRPLAPAPAMPASADTPPPIEVTRPDATPITVVSSVTYPRVAAFHSAAAPGQWDTFLPDIMQIAVPDQVMRTIVLRRTETTLSKLEAWFKKLGDATDVFVIGCLPPASQGAGELLNICFMALEALEKPMEHRSDQSRPPQRHLSIRMDNGGETFTTDEKRERANVQADLVEVADDEQLTDAVVKLAGMASTDSKTDKEAMCVKVRDLDDGAIRRLLFNAIDVFAVSVDVDPSLVRAFSAVRGVLDASLEKAVHGVDASSITDRERKALQCIRLGKLTKLRWLHLINKDDVGTTDNPFKSFAKLSKAECNSVLMRVVQRLQQAWIFSAPKHAGNILQLMGDLTSSINDGIEADMDWVHISTFVSKVMRRVCRQTEGFAGRSVAATEPPDRAWTKDTRFEWVTVFNNALTLARCNQLQMKKELFSHSPKLVGGKVKDEEGKGKRKGKGKQATDAAAKEAAAKLKAAKVKAKADMNDVDDDSDVTVTPAGEKPGTKRKREHKEICNRLGEKDGKWPCYFYHSKDMECHFTADKCRGGYHD